VLLRSNFSTRSSHDSLLWSFRVVLLGDLLVACFSFVRFCVLNRLNRRYCLLARVDRLLFFCSTLFGLSASPSTALDFAQFSLPFSFSCAKLRALGRFPLGLDASFTLSVSVTRAAFPTCMRLVLDGSSWYQLDTPISKDTPT
jgi:hypothetical protein